MGGEGDAVVGAAKGRARRPHDGHRRSVGHRHRVSAARGPGARVGRGREGEGETPAVWGFLGEVTRGATALLAPLTMGLVASTSNRAADGPR